MSFYFILTFLEMVFLHLMTLEPAEDYTQQLQVHLVSQGSHQQFAQLSCHKTFGQS